MTIDYIAPGSSLGVLGGGQLGRMFAQAAQEAGYQVHVLEPDAHAPAAQVTATHLRAAYDDTDALHALARAAAAVTLEFENVPASALEWLDAHVQLAPHAPAVAVCQDRAAEKALFTRLGVPCAPHAVIACEQDARDPRQASLLPGILKTARMGYDGKGQVGVRTLAELAEAWKALGGVTCVLEQRLVLRLELSVVLARGRDGRIVHYPPQQNLHRGGILFASFAPGAELDEATVRRAIDAAHAIAQGLEYVGVLCVEFFVLGDGSLVANEMAPRPHNSGHHTIDSCDQSQFDLQVRALVGAPLIEPRQHSAAVMLNLLGELWFDAGGRLREPDWQAVLALPGAHLHLYGKREPRPGRKMGHLTFTAQQADEARARALRACAALGLAPF
ncbi:MAG: 5-(carboxyamino)imidazole ribonucleotide synthase [Thiomonas sp. 13-66-29]|jgi:5-(carboxyamino)imidazole ribonucleotide synthase|nr:5-(carboxyamino)imidazole ribonucleotide synthase [Thiomonas sp.]OZB45108.1 MAG: 5-(carboxyamino)imidazole ribonucleotide synthase [Thiomonas sp. 15-66-11]OZB64272.1 MAG: 5-(carboxyamino)imidazole ribonucleotide synthase [Thiomonas sp. 13-66-29]